ncbi:MAG TPA: helix-turn-helix transcriptional regulator [Cyanophyceae cyanobacterium]
MSMQVTLCLPTSTEKETPEQRQGKIVKLAREMQDMTQKQLGDRVGLSQRAIARIEKGQGTTSVLIFRIARVLGQHPNVFEV